MAITETGVVVTTLQGIQATYTEQGQALQIVMDGLTPNTAYRATAYCIDNGIQSTSNTESFTTLAAGTIALTRQSMARQGSNYVIVYTYTSTYALSSSVLRVGNTATAQGVIAGNTITYTISGLTPGVAYIYNITSIDVYTETDNIQSSFVMPVVNTVEIVDTTPSDTEVEVELEYTVDGGFYEGFVSCWESTQDPDTDPSLAHWAFYNGATTVNCDNLTAGTTYKFRADIVLGDGTTEIYSSVVSESTVEHGYAREYFTIKNESDTTNQIYLVAENSGALANISYSTNNGSTWSSVYSATGTGGFIANLGVGQKVLVRHSGTMAVKVGDTYYANSFRATGDISVSGNINSLLSMGSFYPITRKYYPSFSFYRLFMNGQVVSAKNLYFGNIPLKENAMNSIFRSNARLVDVPDLSGISGVERMGMYMAFAGCPIQKGANLRNIRTVGDRGLQSIYENCSYLSEAYAPSVSSWNTSNMNNWLNGVSATGVVFKPASLTIPTGKNGVPSGWTTQDY